MADIISFIDDLERETSPLSITPGREAAILRAMLSRVEAAEHYVRRMIDTAAGGDLSQAVEDATLALEELKKTVDYRAILSRLDTVESKAESNALGIDGLQSNLDSEIEGVNTSIDAINRSAGLVARGTVPMKSVAILDSFAFPHQAGWWTVMAPDTDGNAVAAAALLVIPSGNATVTQWLFGDLRLLGKNLGFGYYKTAEMIAFRTRSANGTFSDWKLFDAGRAEARIADIESSIGAVSTRLDSFKSTIENNSRSITNIDAMLRTTDSVAQRARAFPISECRAFSADELFDDDGSFSLASFNPDTSDPSRRWKYGIGHIDGLTTEQAGAMLGIQGSYRLWFVYAFSCGMVEQSSELSTPKPPLYVCAVVKNFLKADSRVTGPLRTFWAVNADKSFRSFRMPTILEDAIFSTPPDIETGSLELEGADAVLRRFDGSSFVDYATPSCIAATTAAASLDADPAADVEPQSEGGEEQP